MNEGLNVENTGDVLVENKVPGAKKPKRRKKRYSYQHNTVVNDYMAPENATNKSYGILRLENDENCLNSFGVEYIKDNDLPTLNQPNTLKTLSVEPFGISKLAWLDAEGTFVKNDISYRYDLIEKGTYEMVNSSESHRDMLFQGEKLKGLYRLDLINSQITYLGEDDGTH